MQMLVSKSLADMGTTGLDRNEAIAKLERESVRFQEDFKGAFPLIPILQSVWLTGELLIEVELEESQIESLRKEISEKLGYKCQFEPPRQIIAE
jgi:hypothetical protein